MILLILERYIYTRCKANSVTGFSKLFLKLSEISEIKVFLKWLSILMIHLKYTNFIMWYYLWHQTINRKQKFHF